MADDAIGFFKTWRLGSFLKGPPGLSPVLETPTTWVGTSWGEFSIPNSQGPGGRAQVVMPVVLWNAQSPYVWEDLVAFHRARAKYVDDVRTAAGGDWSNSVYLNSGWLVWIENETTDVGTLTALNVTGPPGPPDPEAGFIGYAFQFGLDELTNLAIGEYVYLRRVDGTFHVHDVARVYFINRDDLVPGQTIVYVEVPDTKPLAGAGPTGYNVGDLIAHVVQAWEVAYLEESGDLPGIEPGANKVEPDVEVTFGVASPAVPAS